MTTVLVVDDERLIRWALAQTLSNDFVVHTATGTDEALGVLEHTSVDAIVTDLNMPGRSGVDLITTVRDKHPEMRFFVVSTFPCRQVMERLQDLCVLACIHKPFRTAELLRIVKSHLGAPAA